MSDDFNKKTKTTQKTIDVLRKDVRFRQQQSKRGQTTYQLDAQIRGSLHQLESLINALQKDALAFKQNPKYYGLSNKQVQKRVQQFEKLKIQYGSLKRANDAFFQKKPRAQDLFTSTNSQDQPRADLTKMNSAQLREHRKKQEEDQDAAVDDLINIVKTTKTGGQNIHNELKQQDKLLNQTGQGMDDNMQNMGRIRKNMVKLMQESSYFCLIAIIVIQILAIVLLLVLWH